MKKNNNAFTNIVIYAERINYKQNNDIKNTTVQITISDSRTFYTSI